MTLRPTSKWLLALALLLASGAGGCPPGSLEDPERFLAAAGDSGAGCPPGFDVEVDLFKAQKAPGCGSSLCHDAVEPEGKLDLASDGVASRLIGTPSSDTACSTRLLIDPVNPDQSFLLEKITSKSPECGEQMPDSAKKLSPAQIQCVKDWVFGLVGSGSDSGSGGAAGGDSGGGG